MFRDAGNYRAGNGREIAFSQFQKTNASVTSGVKLGDRSLVEASLILDRANDIGYPALPMDVSLAEAAIASVRFETIPRDTLIRRWETKIYLNAVTHVMDDTARPDVAIHMDMPGRTRTFGGYSAAEGVRGKHKFKANLNAFYNASHAEMTMYPQDPNENPMFMLTWPDVRTLYGGIFLEDTYEFNCHAVLRASVGAGYHGNRVASDFGMESLRIFYPGAPRDNSRFLKSAAASLSYGKALHFSIGGGYGERAPSVSEGYGFYLFNSFDNHDYIGNPGLANEKSIEANASAGYRFGKSSVKLSGTWFRIFDYIIGTPNPALSPMTIGADGVRVYRSLPYALISNVSLDSDILLAKGLRMRNRLTWAYGSDHESNPLPLISPISYRSSVTYVRRDFECGAQVWGHAVQSRPAPFFGEDKTPAFAVLDVTAGYRFNWNAGKIYCKAGIENLLDSYYSTFSDWNDLPRRGRNAFVNLVFSR